MERLLATPAPGEGGGCVAGVGPDGCDTDGWHRMQGGHSQPWKVGAWRRAPARSRKNPGAELDDWPGARVR